MSPLPQVISRNNIQKTNKRVTGLVNDVVQPTTWYTCPTGKIAIVKGTCQCVDTGAGANGTLSFAGVIYATWLAAGCDNSPDRLATLCELITINFTAYLAAGETIITDQDSGTNAQFKVQLEIEEFII